MAWWHKALKTTASYVYCFLGIANAAYAGTALTERVAVEAGVRDEVGKDLALPYNPKEGLLGRTCLDGLSVADFSGEIVKYRVNLECPYSGQEVVLSPEKFAETLTKYASEVASRDIFAAQARISTVSIYILAGIRFTACDFKATELRPALDLALSAREGNQNAIKADNQNSHEWLAG